MRFKFITNIFKIPLTTNHTFFSFIWFINANYFWNINYFILQHFYNSSKHSCNKYFADNTCLFPSQKTHMAIIAKLWVFSIFFKGRLSSKLNLIFMNLFYIHMVCYLFFNQFLMRSKIFVHLLNTSLLLFVEARIKYLFPFFS